MTDSASEQTQSRPVRIVRTRRHAAASQRNRGPGLRGRLGGRFTARRAGVGGTHPRSDDARCRWPPASSTSGRRPPSRWPSRSTASTGPTRAASCSGIGVGHPEAITEYRKPYDALVEYLDQLDEYGVPANRRVVAALGPRVLKLSAQRSAGAHPYLTTPEHTAQARELIGPSAFLAPEHKVVLTTDADKARAVGRKALDIYFNLANYRNSWKRLGFSDDEVTRPGSDRLVDAVVAYGTPEAIAARLNEHLDAGADHVPVQILTKDENLVSALAELAGPLGLNQA